MTELFEKNSNKNGNTFQLIDRHVKSEERAGKNIA